MLIRAGGGRVMSRRVWFHRAGAILWTLAIPASLIWWADSIAFVILASCYANIKSDWGAAEAADDREIVERLERIERQLDQS